MTLAMRQTPINRYPSLARDFPPISKTFFFKDYTNDFLIYLEG